MHNAQLQKKGLSLSSFSLSLWFLLRRLVNLFLWKRKWLVGMASQVYVNSMHSFPSPTGVLIFYVCNYLGLFYNVQYICCNSTNMLFGFPCWWGKVYWVSFSFILNITLGEQERSSPVAGFPSPGGLLVCPWPSVSQRAMKTGGLMS